MEKSVRTLRAIFSYYPEVQPLLRRKLDDALSFKVGEELKLAAGLVEVKGEFHVWIYYLPVWSSTKGTYTLVTSEALKTYPLIDDAVIFPKEKDYGTAQVVDELYPAIKGTILK